MLHSPKFRDEFADNLRNNLARVPLAKHFDHYRDAGKALARLHLNYESAKPYPLAIVETAGVPLTYRVNEKMRLADGGSRLIVNSSLTLEGIPADAHRYKLGNRSALDWVISQYHSDESDPNRDDDEEYIVRLVAQVVEVSLRTIAITDALDI